MKKYLAGICSLLLIAGIILCFSACTHTHSYGSWTTEKKATCEKNGRKVRQCDCGDVEEEKIPKLEHEYELTEEKAASCQSVGAQTYTCKVCKDSYTKDLDLKTYSSTEIYEMYLGSVGEIITYDKNGNEYALGSCFVYEEDGKLVTNYHVMEGAYSATVTFGEKTYDIKKVLAYDKDIDVAVLKISTNDLKPALLCEIGHSVGETVYAFGNSRGLTSTFSDGMITYSSRELNGIRYVQHDAPISNGNSGGPLINIYGEVIGINTWTVQDSQNLNFAICISEMQKLDYSNPMTMKQFYEAEGNAYKKLVNFVTENSELSDGFYFLIIDEEYASGYSSKYSIFASYYPDDGDLLLGLSVDGEYYVYFYVDPDASGAYDWYYFDDYDYSMSGTLYAATFHKNALLAYDDYNIYNADMRSAVCDLASSMMVILCNSLTDSFSSIDVTSADLGFSHF